MNKIDQQLEGMPASTNSWHCPWFRAIIFFAILAIVFGLWAATGVAVLAAAVAASAAVWVLSMRTRGGNTC